MEEEDKIFSDKVFTPSERVGIRKLQYELRTLLPVVRGFVSMVQGSKQALKIFAALAIIGGAVAALQRMGVL